MTHPTRRQVTQGLLFGGVSAAIGTAGARATGAARRGGTLNVVIQPEPPILVSLTHTAGPTTRVSPKVTEGLVTFDLDFNPLPQLATEWRKSDDGLRYTFTLRRGVKWHDGHDFTAADVAYSIELLKQHHPRGRGTLASVREVLTPEPHVAECHSACNIDPALPHPECYRRTDRRDWGDDTESDRCRRWQDGSAWVRGASSRRLW